MDSVAVILESKGSFVKYVEILNDQMVRRDNVSQGRTVVRIKFGSFCLTELDSGRMGTSVDIDSGTSNPWCFDWGSSCQ